ncbi:MAG: ThiF family adenylyltransferase [Chloroflexi bacterium]|nr:ThiF family adenylyltransferase [Chloroflexota bacterium]
MSNVLDDSFDIALLESFLSDLVASGFEPMPGSDRQRWRGPIHSAFECLTTALTMDIVIAPGWPFQPPAVLVQGLATNHSTLDGLVCLWREGDDSLRWTTLEGLCSRIEEWCHQAAQGWQDDALGRDALLNFQDKSPSVAMFDLSNIGVSPSSWGGFHGVVAAAGTPVMLGPGVAQPGQLRGMWFHVGELDKPPPRHFPEVLLHLARNERRQLQEQVEKRIQPRPLTVSGGVDLVMFCWERDSRPDLLVMALQGLGEDLKAIALQPGPNDQKSLLLRAGPDASTLADLRAVIFGAGALGGHVAVVLSESGLGTLDIIDADVLTPGNVVRHVAGHWAVGAPKATAVATAVAHHAPWTKTNAIKELPRTPTEIQKRIEHADIVVDATGDSAFTRSVAQIALTKRKSLISGALYRGGLVGRVRRQAQTGDTPLEQRLPSGGYPLIPRGQRTDDFVMPEIGCSAPVNNAPPAVVLAGSSLIAQSVIDVLTGRFELPNEIIEVYRPLPHEPPFHRIGRL